MIVPKTTVPSQLTELDQYSTDFTPLNYQLDIKELFFDYNDATCLSKYDYTIAESSTRVTMLTGGDNGDMSVDFTGGIFSEQLTFQVEFEGTVLNSKQVMVEGYYRY